MTSIKVREVREQSILKTGASMKVSIKESANTLEPRGGKVCTPRKNGLSEVGVVDDSAAEVNLVREEGSSKIEVIGSQFLRKQAVKMCPVLLRILAV